MAAGRKSILRTLCGVTQEDVGAGVQPTQVASKSLIEDATMQGSIDP